MYITKIRNVISCRINHLLFHPPFIFQAFVPNGRNVYGSASAVINIRNDYGYECGKWTHTSKFSQVIDIAKTNIKAINRPTQRCSQENEKIDSSACIAKFVETKLGCNTMILGSRNSKLPACRTNAELMALVNISKILEQADDNDIYEMTGCLSPCKRYQYKILPAPLEKRQTDFVGGMPCEFHLKLRIKDRSYKEEEQYIIYDTSSFIADVGGYLGLLLGSSLFSLYMELEACLRRILRRGKKIEA